MTTTTTQTPAELFSTLQAARDASVERKAETDFLTALPWRGALWGSVLAYGVVRRSTTAKIVGGVGLAALALEYFTAHRRQQLAAAAAQQGAP